MSDYFRKLINLVESVNEPVEEQYTNPVDYTEAHMEKIADLVSQGQFSGFYDVDGKENYFEILMANDPEGSLKKVSNIKNQDLKEILCGEIADTITAGELEGEFEASPTGYNGRFNGKYVFKHKVDSLKKDVFIKWRLENKPMNSPNKKQKEFKFENDVDNVPESDNVDTSDRGDKNMSNEFTIEKLFSKATKEIKEKFGINVNMNQITNIHKMTTVFSGSVPTELIGLPFLRRVSAMVEVRYEERTKQVYVELNAMGLDINGKYSAKLDSRFFVDID